MKESNKSLGCSIGSVIGVIVAIVLTALIANSDGDGFPPYLIPTVLVIGILAFIMRHANERADVEEIRNSMGEQYTRNNERIELCRKVLPDDAQFNTFNALDFPVVMFNEGSSAVWAYDAETEKVMLHWLVMEKDVDKLGNRFYALHKEITGRGIKCEKDVILQNREKGDFTDPKYTEGLASMKFQMVFSKDTGWDDIEIILRQMIAFAIKNANTIASREYKVQIYGREYLLTYHGFRLESVARKRSPFNKIARKQEGDYETLDRDSFLMDYPDVELLYGFVEQCEYDEDYALIGWK